MMPVGLKIVSYVLAAGLMVSFLLGQGPTILQYESNMAAGAMHVLTTDYRKRGSCKAIAIRFMVWVRGCVLELLPTISSYPLTLALYPTTIVCRESLLIVDYLWRAIPFPFA